MTDLFEDPEGVMRKILSDLGSPITNLSVDVAIRKAESLEGIYFVSGKGNYLTEGKARSDMTDDDMLYKIDVYRLE